MDSATLEPMDVYLDADPIDEGNPEEESLFDLAEAVPVDPLDDVDPAERRAWLNRIDLMPCPYCVGEELAIRPCRLCHGTGVVKNAPQREDDASPDDFDEWCRACEEEFADYPDREAYEAGRYITTATGGR